MSGADQDTSSEIDNALQIQNVSTASDKQHVHMQNYYGRK